jgi:hypothetical protein
MVHVDAVRQPEEDPEPIASAIAALANSRERTPFDSIRMRQ